MSKHRRILALAIALSACGGDGKVSFESRFATVESCTGIAAPFPKLRFEPAVECPTSHRRCCLESIPFFDCPAGRCGANGEYEQETGTIVLPVGCSIAFEHESVHHLLFSSTGDPDVNHTSPLFKACGNS